MNRKISRRSIPCPPIPAPEQKPVSATSFAGVLHSPERGVKPKTIVTRWQPSCIKNPCRFPVDSSHFPSLPPPFCASLVPFPHSLRQLRCSTARISTGGSTLVPVLSSLKLEF